MYELIYNRRISISHFVQVEYEECRCAQHGHIITVSLLIQSMKLNAYNVIINTDRLDKVLDTIDNKCFNDVMRGTVLGGGASLENILIYIKSKVVDVIKEHNKEFNTDVQLVTITLTDDKERTFRYTL